MCSLCLCTLSASASIHPAVPIFGKFPVPALFLLQATAHALAVDPSTCPDEWRPTASTFYPNDQKGLELCHSYAQNQVQNAHSKRISWLLVAVSNATLIVLQH